MKSPNAEPRLRGANVTCKIFNKQANWSSPDRGMADGRGAQHYFHDIGLMDVITVGNSNWDISKESHSNGSEEMRLVLLVVRRVQVVFGCLLSLSSACTVP